MRDVFYFPKTSICLDDMKELAARLKYRAVIIPASSHIERSLVIYYSNDDYWRLHEMAEADFFEEDEKAKLREMQTLEGFQILYMSISMPYLKAFLKMALEYFGGWVGCNDEWEHVYELDNIVTLSCFQDETL